MRPTHARTGGCHRWNPDDRDLPVLAGIDGYIAGLFGTDATQPQSQKALQPLRVTDAFTSPPFFPALVQSRRGRQIFH